MRVCTETFVQMSTVICVSARKTIVGERVYFGSQLKDIACHGGEVKAVGTEGSWSHYIYNQKAE